VIGYLKGRKYLTKPDRISRFYERLKDKDLDSFNFKHRKFQMRLRILSLSWYLQGMVLPTYQFKRLKDKRFLKYNKYER
jgi:hypothetical protein